jgi:short-subunit dehydrogenase
MESKNKIALIAGGTHGIEAQTALQLAAEGVKLSIVARNADATETEKKIKRWAVNAL